MRYLGIDFGTKKIGLAISDDENKLAFPYKVIGSGVNTIEEIKNIIANQNIGEVVIGESKDFEGKENKLMKVANQFKNDLEKDGVVVHFEPEFLTSHQAEKFFIDDRRSGAKMEKMKGKDDMLDARAAAIILQSFLDKLR